MTPSQNRLRHLDVAFAHFDQALAALRQIPKTGEVGSTVDGIEYVLEGLPERLHSLRDAVAGWLGSSQPRGLAASRTGT